MKKLIAKLPKLKRMFKDGEITKFIKLNWKNRYES